MNQLEKVLVPPRIILDIIGRDNDLSWNLQQVARTAVEPLGCDQTVAFFAIVNGRRLDPVELDAVGVAPCR